MDILLLSQVCNIFHEEREIKLKNYSLAQKNFESGLISEFDLCQEELQYSQICVECLKAENELSQAMKYLYKLTGISAKESISLTTRLLDETENADYKALSTNEIVSSRLDCSILSLEKNILDEKIKMEYFAWIPTIGTAFSLSRSSGSNECNFNNHVNTPISLGFEVNWPIVSGGSTFFKAKQAKIEREQVMQKIEATIRNIQLDEISIYRSLALQKERVDTSKRVMQVAERSMELAQTHSSSGLITLKERNESIMEYRKAQLGFWQENCQFKKLIIDWKRHRGEYYE